MPVDFTFYLWAGSLWLSLAAVVLFLWLMREPVKEEGGDGAGASNRSASSPRGEALSPPAGAQESSRESS